jgi:hypothetical protein
VGQTSDRLFKVALWVILLVAALLVLAALGLVPSGGIVPAGQ